MTTEPQTSIPAPEPEIVGEARPAVTPPPPGVDVPASPPGGDSATRLAAGAGKLGPVILAVLAFIWGYNWVVMKVGLGYSQPFTFAALRCSMAAVGLLVLVIVLRRPLRPKAIGMTALLGLLQTGIFTGLVMWALQSGGTGRIAVLTYTMPFWLLVLAWGFLGERPRGLQWLAVAVALVGMLMVLAPWQMSGTLSSLLAVASALTWASSVIVAKLLQQRHEVDVLSLTAWQMLLGSVPIIVIAVASGESMPTWSASFIGALAYNVVLAQLLAWLLWLYVLRVLRAGEAGFGTLAIPVIGAVAAWIQLGEAPTAVEGAGMVLIVCALTVITVWNVLTFRRSLR
jgi:drug/metabolite transporter (DMT)-like permease